MLVVRSMGGEGDEEKAQSDERKWGVCLQEEV
jgi:hypothetical protein